MDELMHKAKHAHPARDKNVSRTTLIARLRIRSAIEKRVEYNRSFPNMPLHTHAAPEAS
jgi:hypothetical protein